MTSIYQGLILYLPENLDSLLPSSGFKNSMKKMAKLPTTFSKAYPMSCTCFCSK